MTRSRYASLAGAPLCPAGPSGANGTSDSSAASADAPIFVFSAGASNSSLGGGRANVDAKCSGLSTRPTGFSNYRALISFSASDQLKDLPASASATFAKTRPLRTANNEPIAANWVDFLDGSIFQSLRAAGVTAAATTNIWTGSDATGAFSTACGTGSSVWGSNTASTGAVGSATSRSSGSYLGGSSLACTTATVELICIAF